MAKLTKQELKDKLAFNANDNKVEIYIPNTIFALLANDDELNKTNGKRRSTHVAEAYCYVVLTTYLYRHCKYGWMEDASMKALQEMIGFSYDYKKFNYVIKKDGVLDKLGLTKTIPIKDAPVDYEMLEGGFVEFYTQADLDGMDDPRNVQERKEMGLYKNTKNAKVKEPQFALYGEDGEYGYGTFFGYIDGDNVANTHKIDMDVFIECMTNENLGCTAFYLYSYLQWKCDISQGVAHSIEIGLDKIANDTGVLRGARDTALHGLKAHNLINCTPAPFIVGGFKGEGANIYSIRGMKGYTAQAEKYTVRTLIPVEKFEMTAEVSLNKKREDK